MFKSFLVASVLLSQVLFAAPPKTVSVEEVVGYVTTISNKSKTLSSLAQNISFSKDKKSEYLAFVKAQKLENLSTPVMKVDGLSVEVGNGVVISFADLKSGFIKVNGKSLQVGNGESVHQTYVKIQEAIKTKSALRSLLFEDAIAADSLQMNGAAAGILVNTAENVYRACLLPPRYKDGDTTVTLCPFFEEAQALLKLFPENEFPIDFTCKNRRTIKVPSLFWSSEENVYDMPRSLVTATGIEMTFEFVYGNKYPYYLLKENGVEVCKVNDPARRMDLLNLKDTFKVLNSKNGKYTSEVCATLFQGTFNCCTLGDRCLNKLAENIDREKVDRLYQLKRYDKREAILPSPLSPSEGGSH